MHSQQEHESDVDPEGIDLEADQDDDDTFFKD